MKSQKTFFWYLYKSFLKLKRNSQIRTSSRFHQRLGFNGDTIGTALKEWRKKKKKRKKGQEFWTFVSTLSKINRFLFINIIYRGPEFLFYQKEAAANKFRGKKGKKKKNDIYSKSRLTSFPNRNKNKNSKRMGLEQYLWTSPESRWLFHLYPHLSTYFGFLSKDRKGEMVVRKVHTYEYLSLINLFYLCDRITTSW